MIRFQILGQNEIQVNLLQLLHFIYLGYISYLFENSLFFIKIISYVLEVQYIVINQLANSLRYGQVLLRKICLIE